MKTPEVRIYFSWQLYDNVSVPLSRLEDGIAMEPKENYWQYAANYRAEWAKYADRVLTALVKALDVEFYQDIINAPCTPGIIPFSDPLAFNFYHYPDQFVDVLTHELCHVLLTDNSVYSIHSSEERINLDNRWKRLFGGEHSTDMLDHIPVDALCKYIYLDVLKEPERLERDIKNLDHLPDYKLAWEYVQFHDYHQIITQLKTDFQKLKKELAAK